MSNLAQVSALVGFLLPLLIAVVQRSHWSRTVRTVIGVGASLGTAFLTAWLKAGTITWSTWGTSFILVLGAAMVAYKTIWVPLGAAPWIETNILPGKPVHHAGAGHPTTHRRTP